MSDSVKQQVPEGYKHTEVGVIPEDWNIPSLRQLTLDMLQGVNTAIDIPEYVEDGIPMLKANNVIDQVVKFQGCDSISQKTYEGYSGRFKLKKNDFLFSNIGARLGTGSLLEEDVECSFAWNVMRIIPDQKKIEPRFLAFQINSPKISEKIKSEQSGSGMGFIPKTIMLNVQLPIPKRLKEQTAIANALSDVDTLITSLEKLITKKRAIKTAAMQQLLTSKKRLPPFDKTHTGYKQTELGEIPEDWGVRSFSNVVKDVIDNRGKTPPLTVNGFPMLEVNAVYKQGKNPNLGKVTKYVSEANFNNWFRDGHPETGNILVVTVGSAGETSFVENPSFCIAQNLIALKISDAVDAEFLFYITKMRTFRQQVDAVLMGAVQPSLKVPHLLKFNFLCPKNKTEQVAIANVLSDMDSDIAALQQRLNKTRQLKQGMMQELLTGRTRLV